MIASEFYKSNRQKLISSLQGGVVILTSFSGMQRDNDSAYPFIPESNFWWLTGIDKPDWRLIIDGGRQKSWLIPPNLSDVDQIFNGSLSPESAIKISGVDGILTNEQAIDMMHNLARQHSVVYTVYPPSRVEYFDFVLNPALKKMRAQLDRIFNDVQDCRLDLAKLRAIKDPYEVAAIKKAIKITAGAFEQVKSNITNYNYEYEIEAEFTYNFIKCGSDGHAFDPIVASGENACTMHYCDNRARLKRRDLVLMDIGARFNGYPADITRTYSLGEPTNRQIQIHQAVDLARRQTIDLLGPNLALSDYQRQSDQIMIEALRQLDLYNTPDDFRRYFPHAISHGLGVDIHDSLGRPRCLMPGMILTVEPGIYVPAERIGVRIEDDILITDNGCVNLSAAIDTGL